MAAIQRVQDEEETNTGRRQAPAAHKEAIKPSKSLLFKHIAKEMDAWRDFARELDITEAKIMELEESRLDIATITHRILALAEQIHGDQLHARIREALVEIKRKDIVRQLVSKGMWSAK